MTEKLDKFPGATNQVRCFNYVVNIVAQNITCQFDVPKVSADAALAAAKQALQDLALGIDIEEAQVQAQVGGDDESSDEDSKMLNGEEDWADERDLLSKEELKKLNLDVLPVQVVLVKVRKWRHNEA
jgi:hypothetical protein